MTDSKHTPGPWHELLMAAVDLSENCNHHPDKHCAHQRALGNAIAKVREIPAEPTTATEIIIRARYEGRDPTPELEALRKRLRSSK